MNEKSVDEKMNAQVTYFKYVIKTRDTMNELFSTSLSIIIKAYAEGAKSEYSSKLSELRNEFYTTSAAYDLIMRVELNMARNAGSDNIMADYIEMNDDKLYKHAILKYLNMNDTVPEFVLPIKCPWTVNNIMDEAFDDLLDTLISNGTEESGLYAKIDGGYESIDHYKISKNNGVTIIREEIIENKKKGD